MTNCIKFNGHLKRGYGIMRVNGKRVRAHRWFYQNAFEPIPDGKVIHHKCNSKDCINVMHMTVMTKREHDEIHSRLNARLAKYMRRLVMLGLSVSDLSRIYSIPYSTIDDCIKKRTWRTV